MNALVGEKLSIITYKAQTTRHRIMGIVNGEDFQVVYSDTPGLVDRPAYRLHHRMMEYVNEALGDADVFLLVIDVKDANGPDKKALDRMKKSEVPMIIVLNKTDLVGMEEQLALAREWQDRFPEADVIPVSALKVKNVDRLFDLILRRLPGHPAYFDKEQISNRTLRFFVSEIIREKIFLMYEQEIPYSSEIEIESYEEGEKLDKVRANIIVERESQKAIVIGHRGAAIKRLGTEARLDAEEFTGKKIFLELFVKVDKDWRNSDNELKRFGYR